MATKRRGDKMTATTSTKSAAIMRYAKPMTTRPRQPNDTPVRPRLYT
jgi:hypothetical protein